MSGPDPSASVPDLAEMGISALLAVGPLLLAYLLAKRRDEILLAQGAKHSHRHVFMLGYWITGIPFVALLSNFAREAAVIGGPPNDIGYMAVFPFALFLLIGFGLLRLRRPAILALGAAYVGLQIFLLYTLWSGLVFPEPSNEAIRMGMTAAFLVVLYIQNRKIFRYMKERWPAYR